MTGAGQLRESVRLEAYEGVDDGFGNVVGGWVVKATAAARIRGLKGSEEVLAGRLQGVQPYVITIRNAGEAAAINTDWRAVNDRDETIYEIRSIVKDERGAFADLLCETGVA